MNTAESRSRWGRTRLGSRDVSAMAVSVPSGIVLAAVMGALAVSVGMAGSDALVGFLVFSFCLAAPCVGVVWVSVVDRASVRGAVVHEEESVESSWYGRAAAGSFTDVVAFAGLGAVVLTAVGDSVDGSLVMASVVVAAAVSFGIRYGIAARRSTR